MEEGFHLCVVSACPVVHALKGSESIELLSEAVPRVFDASVATEDEPRLGAPLAPARPEMKVLFLFTFLVMGGMMLEFATSGMAKAHLGPF